MALPSDLEARLRSWLPVGASLEVTHFPSGAIDALVRRSDGRLLVLQASADGSEIGVTPELEDDAGFDDGHPFVFDDWESALRVVEAALVS